MSDMFPLSLSVTEVSIHSVRGGLEYELVREDGNNLVVHGDVDPMYEQLTECGIAGDDN